MTEPIFSPGPNPRTVRDALGNIHEVPEHWDFVLPGDAALTRRIKAAGPHYVIQERRGRRIWKLGIWAPAESVRTIQDALAEERSTERYAKTREREASRRERSQEKYISDFENGIIAFLAFDPKFNDHAKRIAQTVARHATPVGSGTVARTKRIPIEQRAEAAVIAWMRHQTTGYDSMRIARVKGMRREIRSQLAQRSRQLLERYRAGASILENCPLQQALTK